ncbi:heterochromatin protein 1-like [Topomyia yanbarensis]|uniref:heterochromatin protein 1-like n=1 Tax=Topomyia yanbarensis TaxID=2498891 RepID=UPI00273A8EE4|nr:heterochromatin protein 1-like [Topomyia yanbarensis]
MSACNEYVVEQIIDKRVRRGKAQYLIKWKDCDPSENTWEPEDNLNCGDLLELFQQEQLKKPPKKTTSRRKGPVLSTDQNANLGTIENVEKNPGNSADGVAKQTKKRRDKKEQRTSAVAETPMEVDSSNRDGFAKGFVADSILGITMENGQLFFLIKWIGVDEVEMVPSKVARLHIPTKVIDFYEDRIIWNSKEGS